MQGRAATTAIAKNYLAFARVLAASLARHHPDLPLFVLLADEPDGYFVPEREPFTMLRLEDLDIPDLGGFRRRYSRKEIAVAAKPYLLDYVLTQAPGGTMFLDPDILVLGDLRVILDHVAGHAVTLTPHLLDPLTDPQRVERELNILQSGVYNAGFVGVREGVSARAFLAWWKRRVQRHCRHDVGEGLYYDQRWLDLAAVFFEDVSILRDPGCNLAYWNLPERRVSIDGERILVSGQPGRFFHFSGFDPRTPSVVAHYSRRLDMHSLGPAAELFARYAQMLLEAGFADSIQWPYAYGSVLQRTAERISTALHRRRAPAAGTPAADTTGAPRGDWRDT